MMSLQAEGIINNKKHPQIDLKRLEIYNKVGIVPGMAGIVKGAVL